ncbi:MAG TPA: YkgJ family cysteine cluster protein [Cytophagaceae bacterium]|nr:YkgJ family cysteine cluster protein [Cytophagaceae bacterium]
MKLHNLVHQAKKAEKETKKLFEKLKKTKLKDLDEKFETLHEKTFQTIDCLTCANCCKTTSPIFTSRDIERLSKHFKIKIATFMDLYLVLDEDKDYVLKTTPCPFLSTDNYCQVYEDRPNACKEYPHTNRKKMYQILDLTLKNTFVCPAVYEIVENIKKEIK